MDLQITQLQFWSGVILALIPQIFLLIKSFQDNKLQKKIAELQAQVQQPLTEAQAQSAMGDALEKLGQAYDRALTTIGSQDNELATLRPLILEIGLLRQQCAQTQLDKDDWKGHAQKLEGIMEENHIIPPAFRRRSLEGDSDKMKAITQDQVDKYLNRKKSGKGENGEPPQ